MRRRLSPEAHAGGVCRQGASLAQQAERVVGRKPVTWERLRQVDLVDCPTAGMGRGVHMPLQAGAPMTRHHLVVTCFPMGHPL